MNSQAKGKRRVGVENWMVKMILKLLGLSVLSHRPSWRHPRGRRQVFHGKRCVCRIRQRSVVAALCYDTSHEAGLSETCFIAGWFAP